MVYCETCKERLDRENNMAMELLIIFHAKAGHQVTIVAPCNQTSTKIVLCEPVENFQSPRTSLAHLGSIDFAVESSRSATVVKEKIMGENYDNAQPTELPPEQPEKKDNQSESLVVPVDTKIIGKEIIRIAAQWQKDDYKKNAVNKAKEIMDRIIHYEYQVKWAEEAISFFKEKLAALEAGEFTFDDYNRNITFNDDRFNRRVQ